MRLGLTNVFRHPAGYLGRLAARPDLAPPGFSAQHGPVRGEAFPDWPLALAGGDRDRAALGLGPGHAAPALGEIPTQLAVLGLFNPLCAECRREAAAMEALRSVVEADSGLAGRLALVGVGSQCSRRALARFRQELGLGFALALDEAGGLMRELGRDALPVFYLLRRGPEGGWVVAWTGQGRLEAPAVLAEARRLLAPAAP
ncbi:MAG: hypothetical protein AB1916_07815 [Thermodesulfobacteriota bacterium]